jgi:hypothetical protein
VISYKFNFLAEAVIKTLSENRDGDIFLIHAGKAAGLSAEFNDLGKVKETFEIKDGLRHGENLDRILSQKLYPQITDCEWLVTLDHDIYINDHEYLSRLIAENCSAAHLAKYAIIASEDHWTVPGGNFVRYFLTTPLLIVNMRHQWGDSPSWDMEIVKEGENSTHSQLYYDTGQRLAEHLGKDKIKCFPPFPDHVLHHFFSEWQWMSDPHYKEQEPVEFAASISRTKMLLRKGFFIPSQREIPLMRKYLYFREVLDELKEEGLEWS